MSYSAPGTATKGTKRFVVQFTGPKVVPIGQVLANPEVLLKIKLTKPAGAIDMGIYSVIGMIMAEVKRTAGVDAVIAAWLSSVDDVAYGTVIRIDGTGAAFTRLTDQEVNIFQVNNRLFYQFVLFNGNATTSGEIQHLKFYTEIVLPEGYTLEQLI